MDGQYCKMYQLIEIQYVESKQPILIWQFDDANGWFHGMPFDFTECPLPFKRYLNHGSFFLVFRNPKVLKECGWSETVFPLKYA